MQREIPLLLMLYLDSMVVKQSGASQDLGGGRQSRPGSVAPQRCGSQEPAVEHGLNLGVWCGQQRRARYVLGAAFPRTYSGTLGLAAENSGDGQKCGRGIEGCPPGSPREAPAPQTRGGRELSGAGVATDPASSRRSISCWG